jgi:hypothetical protein
MGHDVDQMALKYAVSGLTKSNTYAFRYRARNLYGWSAYSPVTMILVASEPGMAAKPTFVSADDNNINVVLNLNTENKGASVIEHEISISSDGTTYTPLIGYDGTSLSYTLNSLVDTLQTGQIYRIRLRARNTIGWGDYSLDCLAAMSNRPNIPLTPVKDQDKSTKTTIHFNWQMVADNAGQTGGRVLGYRVYMGLDVSGAFV